MTLDLDTIVLLTGVASLLATLVMFVCARLGAQAYGAWLWVGSSAASTAGWVLLLGRGVLPEATAIALAHMLLVAAAALTLRGIHRFVGRPRPDLEALGWSVTGVVGIGLLLLAYLAPSAAAPGEFAAAGRAVLHLMAAVSLAADVRPGRRAIGVTAGFAAVSGLWLAIRALLAPAGLDSVSLTEPTPLQSLTAVGEFLTVLLWAVGYISMIVERVLSELAAAREVERAAVEQSRAELEDAYQQVRAREQLFRLTFDQSPLGAALVDLGYQFMRVNETLCRMTGYDEPTLLRFDLTAIVHWDDLPLLSPRVQALAAGLVESFTLELRSLTRAGATIWLQLSARLVQDSQGLPLHFLLLADDITARKEADARLREIERQQQIVLRTIPVQFWLRDLHGRYILASDALCAFYGREPGELTGRLPEEVHAPEVAAQMRADDEQLIAAGQSVTAEHVVADHRGQLHWLEVSRARVYDEQGRLVGTTGVARNITERKESEEALRRSRAQLELALWGGGLGFWDWRVEGGRMEANEQLAALVGRTLAEITPVVEHWQALTHAADLPQVNAAFVAAIEGRASGIDLEYRIRHADESWRWHLVRGHVVERDAAGRALRLIGVTQDITARREAEDALREREALLRSVSDNLPDVLIYQLVRFPDRQAQYRYISAGVSRLWGATPEEAYADPEQLWRHMFPEDRRRFEEISRRVNRDLSIFELEARVQLPGAPLRWSYIRSTPQRLADGSVLWSGVELDITARKQAEEALRRRVDELLALNQIAQALTSWTNLTRALETVGVVLRGLFEAATVTVWLRQDGDALRRLFSIDGRVAVADEPSVALRDAPLARQLIEDPSPQVVAGVADPLLGDTPAGALVVPLRSRGEVVGLLVLRAASDERIYTPSDVALAQTVAGTLATAIENARLFDEAQQHAIERERRRIARDLHDSVNQALLAAARTAELLPRIWELDPEEGREALGNLQLLTRGALAEMRTLLVELRPRALTEVPLHELLRFLASAATARSAAHVATDLAPVPLLPPDVQVALYRVTQEALNNAARHAQAERVCIRLAASPPLDDRSSWSGEISVSVQDDGRGFEPGPTPPARMGLGSMRERAADIGATLEIVSRPDGGTSVTITWRGASATPGAREL